MNAAQAIFNEIKKGLYINWYYRFNLVNEFITLGINFIGMIYLMNYNQPHVESYGESLLGYIIWVYASYILEASYQLTLEGRSGTLEHMYMSPTPPAIIFIGNTSAILISCTILMSIMSALIIFFCNIAFPFTLYGLPIFLLTLIGLIGFGLSIAGAALLYKNVYGLVYLISTILFYVDGSMAPIDNLPYQLQIFTKSLPTTQGIELLRQVIFHNKTFINIWQDGSLLALCINSSCYLMSGLIIFRYCEKHAKIQGKLGLY